MELEKSYNPQSFEREIYERWEKAGYFEANPNPNKKPFTIIMPPPNITGQLHMGHALDDTVQDAIIRYKRMKGFEALWLPGTDHASIATEVKIVEQMAAEGITKADVGREGFLERAWKWREEYGNRIVHQLKYLGTSCDWSKLAFTMDENVSRAVVEVFVNLYNKGLIYQGDRIINWCPECKTAISDAEVEYVEQASNFWHLRYPVKDSDEFIVVATTRPETMLGDTAVAVNPKDERYAHLVGKTLILPLVDREIPIVADEYVDMEFGTGAVKITPAHDPNDFEVGLRHNLPVIRVMNDDGTMNAAAGKFEGLDRFEAREKIVEELKEKNVLIKIEPHAHNVGECYRCHTVIEPIVSRQWFVKMEPLAKPAIDVVKSGELKFIPKRFENIYFNWMENIRDWCISRQLWWGHRIPAYYCQDCGHTMVEKEAPSVCSKCGSKNLKQDEDVLDTWFSSALWPFSTLGYPDKTEALDYFYPTDVLVTAYDIIFFWVARMIFSGMEHMGEKPFKDVLIHGIVRDAQGRKMSKSLGNGIDPIEVIEKYGADTLRFSLLNGISPGGDTRFIDEKVEGCRNFMNKIWNMSRFALMNFEGKTLKEDLSECKLSLADKWILNRLNEVSREVNDNMDKYELGLACSKLYDFVWSELCDWYIELLKPVLYSDDEVAVTDALSVLCFVLKSTLKLLHPFIPFVTEQLYCKLPNAGESIMITDFPEATDALNFAEDAENMEAVMELIRNIRNIRADMGVAPAKRAKLFLHPASENAKKVLEGAMSYLAKLAYASDVAFIEDKSEVSENVVSAAGTLGEIFMELGDLIDVEKELARLAAEREGAMKEIAFAEGKLNNPGFVAKAPQKLLDDFRAKREKFAEIVAKIDERIAALKK